LHKSTFCIIFVENNCMSTNPFHKQEEVWDTDVIDVQEHDLVVFNDDHNTFEHVIETLIDVCGHSLHQADQCTHIIHYKGKCSVKKGDFETLAPMRNDICRRGISAEVV
jgi:ATP-dependent Clp protease adaptor protein ClpS